MGRNFAALTQQIAKRCLTYASKLGIGFAEAGANMTTTFAPTTTLSARATQHWNEITQLFREACVLRRQGRHVAAAAILEQQLPAVIRSWAFESRLPAGTAKARLQELFTEEQARVESSWLISRFVTTPTPLTVNAAPVASPVMQHVAPIAPPVSPARTAAFFPSISPRRIPIDDVVGMLDMVREQERLSLPHALAVA